MPRRRGQQMKNEDDAPRGGLSPRIERVFLYCLILHRTSPTYKNIYSRLKALLDHRAAPGEDPPRPSKVWIEAFLRRYDKLLREIDRAPKHETIDNWFKLLNERETVRHGIKSRHRHCMDFVTLPLSRSTSGRREFAVLFDASFGGLPKHQYSLGCERLG
ncbi:hypothetical protein K474DRAFT_71325 [Panus rudis PR-1116 ss-1]|nr:hypothetical protein K474DRAFT_71325 [Panus rudis PR-1116 ss-1]